VLVGCSQTPAPAPAAPLGACPLLITPAAAEPDTQVRDTQDLTVQPRLVTHWRLQYPENLKRAGISGQATIEVIVDTLGVAEPKSIRVISATHPDFAVPSVHAVLDSRWCPGSIRGRPVRVRIRVPINYAVSRAP
jgi:outer membrane biosynthesis protein TonB